MDQDIATMQQNYDLLMDFANQPWIAITIITFVQRFQFSGLIGMIRSWPAGRVDLFAAWMIIVLISGVALWFLYQEGPYAVISGLTGVAWGGYALIRTLMRMANGDI